MQDDYKTPAEREFDRTHKWLHLDPEIYYDDCRMTSFVLLTHEQYDLVRKWTLESMKKFKEMTGRDGFVESDYEKLEEKEDA